MWDWDLPAKAQTHLLKQSRNLFLQQYPYERIYLETGLPPHIFSRYQGRWEKLRLKVDEKEIRRIRKKKVEEQIGDFLDKGLYILNRQLSRWMKGGDNFEPKDFKMLADSILGLHRVKQLEEGNPTDIQGYENMGPDELREYLIAVATQVKTKHGDLIEYGEIADQPMDELMKHLLPAPSPTETVEIKVNERQKTGAS